ncbi:MAG: glycosyltransferase family 2 protein [Prevotellaceae bacterium]|jgi:glycosyltransferase involved in cell wall biosynthesis|nr:glycosyltransferase family 2 protein [Prevotellaceae bacterium]
MHTLSVIIPAYNEEKTIFRLLQKVAGVQLINGIQKEIIVVDDGSRDATEQQVAHYNAQYSETPAIYFRQLGNRGKGAAIRKGLQLVTGDGVIIQDADLEYDPEDYNVLLKTFLKERLKVIYGSRFLKRENRHSSYWYYLGGRMVTLAANLLYNQRLTDEPTCYKLFDASFLKSIPLSCAGFEFCPEVTAKVAGRGIKIREVPINYYPRSMHDGKKIKWTDGLKAIWTLLKYR